MRRCAYVYPYVVQVFGLIGPFGLTLQLALLFDLITVVTAPLFLSYIIATAVFRRMLVLALSLFNLFRGKYYTVNYCSSYVTFQEEGITFFAKGQISGILMSISCYLELYSSPLWYFYFRL